MSGCPGMRARISAALDQPLPAVEAAALAAHLADCPHCRRFQDDLLRNRERLRRLEPVEPPDWLADRILARVRELPSMAAAPPPPLWRRPALQVAAGLLLCVTTVLLLRPGGPRAVPERAPAPPQPASAGTAVEATAAPAEPERRSLPDKAVKPAASPGTGGFAPAPPPAKGTGATPLDTAEPAKLEPAAPQPAAPPPAAPQPAAPGPAAPRSAPPAPDADRAASPRRFEAQAPSAAAGGARAKTRAAEPAPATLRWSPRDPDQAWAWLEEALEGLGAERLAESARGADLRLAADRLPQLRARLARRGALQARPEEGPAAGVLVVQIRW